MFIKTGDGSRIGGISYSYYFVNKTNGFNANTMNVLKLLLNRGVI